MYKLVAADFKQPLPVSSTGANKRPRSDSGSSSDNIGKADTLAIADPWRAFAGTPDPATPAPAMVTATGGGLLFAHPFFRSQFLFFVIVLY